MAHFAQLDENNVVVNVIVVNNELVPDPAPDNEQIGIDFLKNALGLPGEFKQTSYNGKFRKNYAVIGGVYNASLDAFIREKPYPSWVLNTETCVWEAPIPYPSEEENPDNTPLFWNEDAQAWMPAAG